MFTLIQLEAMDPRVLSSRRFGKSFSFLGKINLLLLPRTFILFIISFFTLYSLPKGSIHKGIVLFLGMCFTPYPEQLAVIVTGCISMLVLYIFLSKYFIKGIALTGLRV